ncbi:hypothetical protein ACNOYE_22100 [Nannocystaceae bacterium ST9]
MSQLLRQLRESHAVDEQALQSASRRQQIYGGSLDTVLLELELIDPVELDAQLAVANRCISVPIAVLEPGPERPWELLPRELVDLGWAMPLRRHHGRIQVAIHPEIPDDRRALLERSVEHVEIFVTCEACLAKLAAERSGSVMPQRYAVLALTWIHRLRRTQTAAPERDPDAPRIERPQAAPWMTVPPNTAPYTMPPPQELSQRKPAEPKLAEPETKLSGRSPTFLYGLPVDDDDAPAVRVGRDAPVHEPTPTPDPAPAPAPTWTAPTTPEPELVLPPEDDDGFVDPLAGLDDDEAIPAPRNTRRAAQPRASAAPLPTTPAPPPSPARPSALQERLAGPRSALEDATGRDQATDALVRAAMVLSRRVGLFGIKREGLRGLASPGEIPDLANQLVEISPAIEAAIEGREAIDLVTDLDLRMAVGQEAPVPCLFLPIRVQDHPVLMLYVDRSGQHFSMEEVEAAYELCDIAGRTLEGVLMRLRSGDAPVKPETEPAVKLSTTPAIPTPVKPASNFKPPTPPIPAPPIKPPVPVPSPSPASAIPPIKPPTSGPLFAPINLPGMPASTRPASGPVFTPPTIPGRPPSASFSAAPPTATTLPSLVVPPPDPELSKPPVRMHRMPSASHPAAEPMLEPSDDVPSVQPGLTALSSPLGVASPDPSESATIRGRIVLDDEDRPRGGPAPALAEIDSAIAAALRGGSSDVAHLRELGEPAMQRIAKQFPGELDVHRRDLDTLPPLPAHGSLIRVALELGRELGPALIEVMDHPNPNTRFYTAFVFQELRDERAIPSLGELSFDPDADVRAIAMRVLETYSAEPGFDTAVALIRRELDSPNRTRQLHSTRAVGTLRDILAVPKLIELLSSKERYIQEAALESLCSITGQQLGLKPHRWKAWYADNAHHHRVEWIISSLAHKDLSVRRWAADELRRITGQRIMFPAAGTKQEREIGLQKWVEWWRDEGRGKFG